MGHRLQWSDIINTTDTNEICSFIIQNTTLSHNSLERQKLVLFIGFSLFVFAVCCLFLFVSTHITVYVYAVVYRANSYF